MPPCLVFALPLIAAPQQLCEEGTLASAAPTQEARAGFSVAVDGDLAVLGAPFASGAAALSGAVYLFERGPGGWLPAGVLTASDGQGGDGFGNELALEGDRLLVGAVWRDGPGVDSGAVYLFERSGGTWGETGKLLPADHGPQDWFGRTVALDGDRALVGASLKADPAFATGAAYVFEWSAGQWTETAKLSASDGAGDDFFGGAIDLDGDRILIGAHGDDDLASESGGAYVFDLVGGQWVETVKLIAADGKTNDDLGVEVALEGDVALLASFGDDDGAADGGSVYVFERGPGGWAETAELLASDASADDGFGSGLDLVDGLALIGAWGHDGAAPDGGASYAFRRIGGSFVEEARHEGSAPGGRLGFDVALSGTTALSGAPEAPAPGGLPTFAGQARVARLAAGTSLFPCPAWISLAAGGSQNLHLKAAPGLAGQLFFVAGSASGTAPGIPVGPWTVPLNPDGYFLLTVAGTPLLTGTPGTLDGTGAGAAALGLLPAFDPSLAGLTVHHAALVLDAASFAPLFASSAAPLDLVP